MHLVLGTPGPVAIRLMSRLIERGESVCTVAPQGGQQIPNGVRLFVGEPTHIDFGLSGADYRALLSEVRAVFLAESAINSPTAVVNARHVRLAAELVEFIDAGGAPDGVSVLSSLLVFGSSQNRVSEEDFSLGQNFADSLEESLALAERIVRRVIGRCPLAIIRSAPVAIDQSTGTLIEGSQLAQLARVVDAAPFEFDQVFSNLPVRLEEVGRAVEALLSAERRRETVIHLVDKSPMTDRDLVQWLAARRGKKVREVLGSARPLAQWLRPNLPGGRVVRGWDLVFERSQAETHVLPLLDRDDRGLLESVFATDEGTESRQMGSKREPD